MRFMTGVLVVSLSLVLAAASFAASDTCLQGAVLQEQGRPTAAGEAFRQCLELEPNNVYAMNQLGLSLLKQGRFEAARVWFQRASAKAPEDTFPRLWLGALNLREHKERKAGELFSQVLELEPENADAHYFLGVLATGRGQAEEAARHFELAGHNGASDPALQCRLARAYVKLDMDDAAHEAYAQALAQAPEHGPALLGLGWLHYNQERPQQAMELWRKAARLPESRRQAKESLALAANALALDACAKGQADKALDFWKQALAEDPGNRAARHYLQQLGDHHAALGGACTAQGGLLP